MKQFKSNAELEAFLSTFGTDEMVKASYYGMPVVGKPHTIRLQVSQTKKFNFDKFAILNEPLLPMSPVADTFGLKWGKEPLGYGRDN